MTNITKGSGNVFADLALPDPEGHLAKAELVRRIGALIKEKGLTQAEAAKLMSMSQPDVSKMLRGLFRPISMDKLFECLRALGQNVQITVTPTSAANLGRRHEHIAMPPRPAGHIAVFAMKREATAMITARSAKSAAASALPGRSGKTVAMRATKRVAIASKATRGK